MPPVEKFLQRAERLFITVTDEFELIFDNDIYNLKNAYNPSCHILEVCLLGQKNMTGKKIFDIATKLHVDSKWIIGFYYGFKNLSKKYKNKDYIEGYENGISSKKHMLLSRK